MSFWLIPRLADTAALAAGVRGAQALLPPCQPWTTWPPTSYKGTHDKGTNVLAWL